MVPEEVTEFVAAATALIATIERSELYKGQEPLHFERGRREAVERMVAALNGVRRLYPAFKAYKLHKHIIYPTVRGGKIVEIGVIPANGVLDVNSILDNAE